MRQVFSITKVGTIAGCMVLDGKMERNSLARVVRKGKVVSEGGKINSLKRFKEDVKEVLAGYECGIGIDRFNDFKPGDIIEAYVQEKVKAMLEAPSARPEAAAEASLRQDGPAWHRVKPPARADMIVAAACITLLIPENDSLKGKRQVVKSLIEKVRHKFDVAVAEVENNDLWQKAGSAWPWWATTSHLLETRLQQMMKFMENQHLAEIIDSQVELCYLEK